MTIQQLKGATGKCLVFLTLQHFSLNISPRFHSIEKWLHRVGVLGPVNIWKVLDDFFNVRKEQELFGGMLKITENWKILDLKVRGQKLKL